MDGVAGVIARGRADVGDARGPVGVGDHGPPALGRLALGDADRARDGGPLAAGGERRVEDELGRGGVRERHEPTGLARPDQGPVAVRKVLRRVVEGEPGGPVRTVAVALAVARSAIAVTPADDGGENSWARRVGPRPSRSSVHARELPLRPSTPPWSIRPVGQPTPRDRRHPGGSAPVYRPPTAPPTRTGYGGRVASKADRAPAMLDCGALSVAISRKARNRLLVELHGELDVASAGVLERKLYLPRRAKVDLDLSGAHPRR